MTTTALPPQPPSSGAGGSGAPQLVAQARDKVRQLREVIWAARGNGEKMDTVAGLEELRSVIDAVEHDVVRDLEATKGVQALGWASTGDFVTAVAGGHKNAGPGTVRLAQSLAESVMTPVDDALAEGWLSVAKARVISTAIELLPTKTDLRARGVEVLLDESARLDATDLRKAARRLVEIIDPDGDERREERALDRQERAAHLERRLSISDDGAGGAFIRGRCSVEDAALIRSSLLPLAKPRPCSEPDCEPATCDVPGCSHDGRDPREHGTRMLDALSEACRRLQTAAVLPECHAAPPRINLVMRLDDLRRGIGYATTDTGEDLPPGLLRRLACDSEVIPHVLGSDSEVLDVGRHQRLVTAAIWRALVVRDRHCRFPGCTRPPVMTHAHHLVHWLDGGPTSLDNLLLLCGHHHRLVHAAPWTITQPAPGRFSFHPPPAVRRSRGPRPDRAPPDG